MKASVPIIVGLGGGTGSGKSAIVQSLVARVGGCAIDLGSYALGWSALAADERSQMVGDEPDTIDVALLVAHLTDLRRGEAIRKPVYGPETRTRTGVHVVAPARLVLVEGLFTLWWPSLRSLLDVKVFVDAPAALRLMRGLRRDLADRGRTVEEVLHKHAGWARTAHDRYVEPTRVHADDVVTNDGPLEDAVEQLLSLVRKRRGESLADAVQH